MVTHVGVYDFMCMFIYFFVLFVTVVNMACHMSGNENNNYMNYIKRTTSDHPAISNPTFNFGIPWVNSFNNNLMLFIMHVVLNQI